ncbi:MAG: MBL fold metallo-hydrolase, partial [Croceibacterium sp.]
MHHDPILQRAIEQVQKTLRGELHSPVVRGFFHEPTFTASYVVHDPATMRAAIVDSVLDFDQASGRTSTPFAEEMIAYVRDNGLTVDWLLETHAHADHLSAAPYLQDKLGGKLVIGRHILTVQDVFGKVFNEGSDFARDGSQFDILLDDGDELTLGSIPLLALHVPGHTPA